MVVEETVLGLEVVIAPNPNSPVLGVSAAAVVVGETTFPKLKDAPVKDDLVDVTSGGFLGPNENIFEDVRGSTAAVVEVETTGEVRDGVVVVKPMVVAALSEPNENELAGVVEKLKPPVGIIVVKDFGGCPRTGGSVEIPGFDIGEVTPVFPKLKLNPALLLEVVVTLATGLDTLDESFVGSTVMLGEDKTLLKPGELRAVSTDCEESTEVVGGVIFDGLAEKVKVEIFVSFCVLELVSVVSLAEVATLIGLLVPANEKLKPVGDVAVEADWLLTVFAAETVAGCKTELLEGTEVAIEVTAGACESNCKVLGISGSFLGAPRPSFVEVPVSPNMRVLSLTDSILSAGLFSFLFSIIGLTTACFSPDNTELVVIFVDSPNLKLETLEGVVFDIAGVSITGLTRSGCCFSLSLSLSSSDSDSSNALASIAFTRFSFFFRSKFIASGLAKSGFWFSSSGVVFIEGGEFLISSDIRGKIIFGGPETSP